MAKNLYNLTAVTTVNNSDLLHVNQGSVSSDYKVTKANLLKEVNSSITSLNNSLANSRTQAGPTEMTTTTGTIENNSYMVVEGNGVMVSVYYYIRVKNPNGRPTITVTGFPTTIRSFSGIGHPSLCFSNSTAYISDQSFIQRTINTDSISVAVYNYLGPFPAGSGYAVLSGSATFRNS